MSIYVAVHEHEYGADAYLFRAENLQVTDAIEQTVAERLEINYEPDNGETMTIAEVINVGEDLGNIPII
jgi:hypothetical protein